MSCCEHIFIKGKNAGQQCSTKPRNGQFCYRHKKREGVFSFKTKLEDDLDYDDCSICMEPFKNKKKINETICKHTFHEECINQWLKVNNNCPLCRQVLCAKKPKKPEPPSDEEFELEEEIDMDDFDLEAINVWTDEDRGLTYYDDEDNLCVVTTKVLYEEEEDLDDPIYRRISIDHTDVPVNEINNFLGSLDEMTKEMFVIFNTDLPFEITHNIFTI